MKNCKINCFHREREQTHYEIFIPHDNEFHMTLWFKSHRKDEVSCVVNNRAKWEHMKTGHKSMKTKMKNGGQEFNLTTCSNNFYNKVQTAWKVSIVMEQELARFRAQKSKEYKSKKLKQDILGAVKLPEWIKTDSVTRNLDRWILALRIALWLILWKVFILMEFGTVYFILSLFYWVYFSMSYGSRKEWEPSAYSVFNKDFETIDGTFTAEQFEKELKYGAGAVS